MIMIMVLMMMMMMIHDLISAEKSNEKDPWKIMADLIPPSVYGISYKQIA